MAYAEVVKYIEGVFSKDAFKLFAQESFDRLSQFKQDILQDVIQHRVSIELETIPVPSPILGASHGSLFGFLGFSADQNPVQDLIDYLDRVMEVKKSRASLYNRLGGTYAKLFLPDKKDMRKEESLQIKASPSAHADGRSWPEWIEEGMSGLDKYIGRSPYGRSTEGIQSKGIARNADFNGVPYLTEIFAKFRKKVKNIK